METTMKYLLPFFLLAGCGTNFAPGYTVADDIVNTWWHLEQEDFDIYLYRYADTNVSGRVWANFVLGIEPTLEDNNLLGSWQFRGGRRFHFVPEEVGATSWTLTVHDNDGDCWTVKMNDLWDDFLCHLEEPGGEY